MQAEGAHLSSQEEVCELMVSDLMCFISFYSLLHCCGRFPRTSPCMYSTPHNTTLFQAHKSMNSSAHPSLLDSMLTWSAELQASKVKESSGFNRIPWPGFEQFTEVWASLSSSAATSCP